MCRNPIKWQTFMFHNLIPMLMAGKRRYKEKCFFSDNILYMPKTGKRNLRLI